MNEQPTNQHHTQTVKIFRGNDEPSIVHYVFFPFSVATEPAVSDDSESDEESYESSEYESYDHSVCTFEPHVSVNDHFTLGIWAKRCFAPDPMEQCTPAFGPHARRE